MANARHNLLAACGLYCGACYHYRALSYSQERLLALTAQRKRSPEGFLCQGCRSDTLSVHTGCTQCTLRTCADSHGVLHCGLCPEFPCARLGAFRDDGRIHHRDVVRQLEALVEQGPELWLAEQDQRWRCVCGERFSWYEEICYTCGAPLTSYGPDPTIARYQPAPQKSKETE